MTSVVTCAAAVAGTEQDETILTVGYAKEADNGLFVRSKDGSFRLDIGLYTQVRYDINWREAPAGE